MSLLEDMIYDIGAGICNCQKIAEANQENSKFNLSKIKKYTPKTNILNVINDILNETDYRKSYEWQHNKIFDIDDLHIEVIKYDINTGEKCNVLINNETVTITKKYLKELWKGRKQYG